MSTPLSDTKRGNSPPSTREFVAPKPDISSRTGLTVAQEMELTLAADRDTLPRSDEWRWGDLHLRHRLTAWLRGFPSVDAQDDTIARVWDLLVRPSDTVYLYGDMSLGGKKNNEYMFDWLSHRPGKKEIILGNHDDPSPIHRRSGRALRIWMNSGIESVQMAVTHQIGPYRVLGSHFPYRNTPDADHTFEDRFEQWRLVDEGRWLIHGHTHLRDQLVHDRMIHVGIDAHPRGPVAKEWIIEQIEHWEPIYAAREAG